MSGYSKAAIDRFAVSRDRIHGGEIRGEMALKDDNRVGISLNDFYAVGCEMARLRRVNADLLAVVEEVRKAVG